MTAYPARERVLREVRQLKHTAGCATGARAETRSKCTCGASEREPAWRIQILRELDSNSRNLIRVETSALDWIEASALYLALHDVQIETARLWELRTRRVRKQALKSTSQVAADAHAPSAREGVDE